MCAAFVGCEREVGEFVCDIGLAYHNARSKNAIYAGRRVVPLFTSEAQAKSKATFLWYLVLRSVMYNQMPRSGEMLDLAFDFTMRVAPVSLR
jgi:hypothetical protein